MSSRAKNTSVLTREAILNVLTDAEVAKVSHAEEAPRLVEGDEYIDLTDPGAGVQQVHASRRTSPENALPRSAVSDTSWAKIVRIIAH